MRVAVLPARRGSRRIPRKNVRPFCGRPIVAYPLVAARESGLFDHVVVSTEDSEIAAVAEAHGAEVPFQRPAELADDFTGTSAVVAHAVRWMRERSWPLDAVCCLYPTAPFLLASDLRAGLERLESGDWDYAFSAAELSVPVFRTFREHPDGGVEMFFPEHFETRSQDLPAALHDAGQFYWGRPRAWLDGTPLFGRRSVPVVLPRWRVQDIDTEDDWRHAELLWQVLARSRDA